MYQKQLIELLTEIRSKVKEIEQDDEEIRKIIKKIKRKREENKMKEKIIKKIGIGVLTLLIISAGMPIKAGQDAQGLWEVAGHKFKYRASLSLGSTKGDELWNTDLLARTLADWGVSSYEGYNKTNDWGIEKGYFYTNNSYDVNISNNNIHAKDVGYFLPTGYTFTKVNGNTDAKLLNQFAGLVSAVNFVVKDYTSGNDTVYTTYSNNVVMPVKLALGTASKFKSNFQGNAKEFDNKLFYYSSSYKLTNEFNAYSELSGDWLVLYEKRNFDFNSYPFGRSAWVTVFVDKTELGKDTLASLELEFQVNNLRTYIISLQNQINIKNKTITDLQAELAKTQKLLADKENEVSQLSSDLQEIYTKLNSLGYTVTTKQQALLAIDDCANRLSQLESAIYALGYDKTIALTDVIKDIDKKLTTLKNIEGELKAEGVDVSASNFDVVKYLQEKYARWQALFIQLDVTSFTEAMTEIKRLQQAEKDLNKKIKEIGNKTNTDLKEKEKDNDLKIIDYLKALSDLQNENIQLKENNNKLKEEYDILLKKYQKLLLKKEYEIKNDIDEVLTRKDLIEILTDIVLAGENEKNKENEPTVFIDIRGLDFERKVTALYERKIIKGIETNLFGLQPATNEMVATIALRLMKFDDPDDFAFDKSVEVLKDKGINLPEKLTKETVKALFKQCQILF